MIKTGDFPQLPTLFASAILAWLKEMSSLPRFRTTYVIDFFLPLLSPELSSALSRELAEMF